MREFTLGMEASKAAIKVGLNRKTANALYFPSYEIFTSDDNIKGFWQDDKRHIHAHAVDKICRHFVNIFANEPSDFANDIDFDVNIVDRYGKIIKERSDLSGR